MVLADVLLGYFVSKLLDKKSATATPPFVVSPSGGTAPAPGTPTVIPPQLPPATPASFPSGQVVPPTNAQPAAGMKRAVEVWIVKPSVASAATVVVGDDVVGAAQTLAALEASFPNGWQAARVVTAQEITTAKSLLPKWKQGGVIFMGPQTMTGRRAYRMTMHPAQQAQPAATPMASPTVQPAPAPTPAPSGIVPASYQPPVATPAPTAVPTSSSTAQPPSPAVSPTPPVATAPTAPTGQQVTKVRRGEGLAQISKRLGMGETQAGAVTIQKANVPNGPDATWKAVALAKGGLQKAGRAGGLQPGDRLWVPRTWGPYNATVL